MSFTDVMYGPLGSVNQGFQNNLGQNAAAMANSNALVNSWQNVPQVSQQQLYGGGSFGAQPAYYAGLGAAYGRATGGFGLTPQGTPAAAGRVGTISNPGAANPAYLAALTRSYAPPAPAARAPALSADWSRMFNPAALGPAQSFSPNYSALSTRGFTMPQAPQPQYNAARQYGWLHNEGAPAPAAPAFGNYNPFSFNPAAMRASATSFQPSAAMGRPISAQGTDRFGAFNPYSFNPGAMGAPASAFARTAGASSGGIGSDMLRGGQNALYAQPWHSLIPTNRGLNMPEIIKQVNYTAGRGRYDPAALAGVINTESRWNPATNLGSYFGATQMGAKSFQEAGGRLGGMNFNQYKAAPLERQIPAYGDWLAHYARAPNSAAAMATSGALRQQPVPMQSAFLQGTQFAPYAGLPNTINWPAAFARGDTSMPVTMAPQAPFLSTARGLPPTLSSMNAYYGRTIPR